jgi:GT2 family glycosyltransferase
MTIGRTEALMADPHLTNVVLTTFNRIGHTRAAIESIRTLTRGPFLLTVVDNASTDGTREYLKAELAAGRIDTLFLLERNMGVACACNLGLAAHAAPFFVKFDNDVRALRPDWLERLVTVAGRNAIVGALAYDVYGHGPPTARLPDGEPVRIAGFCGGSCMVVRRDVLQRLGFFCEDYGLYGEEDADFGVRLGLAGLASAYLPDADAVAHDAHAPGAHDHLKPRAARKRNIQQFQANVHFYETGLRPLFVGRKYAPESRGELWGFSLDRAYAAQARKWNRFKKLVDFANREWVEDYIRGRR